MVTYIYTECWGNIKKTVQLLILLLFWKSETEGACTNAYFSSDTFFHRAMEVRGTCYYIFNNPWLYPPAEGMCSHEGMRLPHYENETKQRDVTRVLGISFKHWMGLKYVSGTWQWWDAITVTGTPMTSARWEGQSSGLYAETSNSDGGLWIAKQLGFASNLVCEDNTGATETTTPIPTPEETTTLIPTPEETTDLIPTPAETTALIPTPEETTTLIPTPEETTALIPTPEETTDLIPTPEETTDLIPTPEETTALIPAPEEATALIPIPEETTDLIPTPEETTALIPTPEETTDLIPIPEETTDLIPIPEETTDLIPTPAETTALIPIPEETTALIHTPEETTTLSTVDIMAVCKDIADSGTKMMWFKKAETIRSVEVTAEMAVVSKLDCARRCLCASSCCSFSFNKAEKTCRHFRFVESGNVVTCTSPESCFTFN